MLKPNILIIIIDGFRADKCHGPNKTSITPNLDSLISNGVYFNQAVSSSDGTRTCVGSIFTADYPFKSGLNTFYNHKKSTRYFDHLKKQGYSLFATAPDVDLWQTLTKILMEQILLQNVCGRFNHTNTCLEERVKKF